MTPFLTILTSALTAALTGLITFSIQERRIRAELRTEFMAEQALRHLLQVEKWRKRSFAAIQRRIGGFTDDELRKLLVRAGAVRFEEQDGGEVWGLLSRNEESLG